MHLHIDADRLAYAVGFACQKKDESGELIVEPIANALHSVKLNMKSVTTFHPSVTGFTVYLTGEGNFRETLYPEYKANRKGTEKPVHWKAIRDYLIEHWDAQTIVGMEADDACSLALTEDPDAVCVSNDKDLLTVPGWHLKPTKLDEGLVYVTEEEALRFFYTQLLWGDSVDNIPGLSFCADTTIKKYKLHSSAKKGCGEKSAIKILAECETEDQMYEAVLEAYYETEKQELEAIQTVDVVDGWEGLCLTGATESLILNAQLLHMTREMKDGKPVMWQPPIKQEE